MKKFIAVLALCALACSAFAATTMTNWYYYDEDFEPVMDSDCFADFNDSGAQLLSGVAGYARFTTDNVQGWVYDENDTFNLYVEGFNILELPFDPTMIQGTQIVAVLVGVNEDDSARYELPWNENGEYKFDNSALVSGLGGEGEFAVQSVDVWIQFALPGGMAFIPYTFTEDTTGVFSFEVIEKPVPVEVPEPAAFAYAAMGLASAFGLKRRIRK